MLVPNPTSEAKVLIGDKEAEETSDLSDVTSDYGESEYTPAINTILVESKSIIGGRNLLNCVNLNNEGREDECNEDKTVIVANDDTVAVKEEEEEKLRGVDENGICIAETDQVMSIGKNFRYLDREQAIS